MKRLLALVTAICLTFLLFSLATQWVSDNEAYYRRQMIQNDIPRVTGKSLKELDEISDGLRDYLKRGDERALTPYFSKSEVDHMVDVYALFHLMRRLTLAAAVLAAMSFYVPARRAGVREGLRSVGKATIVLIAAFALLALLIAANFSKAWYTFHTLFFSNKLWLMDPEKDLMIQMLPEPFFFGMVKQIGLVMAVGLLILASLAFLKGNRNEIK